MRAEDVTVGGRYDVKILGKVESVEVTEKAADGRLRAVNVRTGQPHVLSPERLMEVVNEVGSTVVSQGNTGLAAAIARGQGLDQFDTPPHLIVEARAGVGKTTTLVEGLKVFMGESPSVQPSEQQAEVWRQLGLSRGRARSTCFVAFNKSIAQELQSRVPAGSAAMTMHSLGYRACLKAFGNLEVNGYCAQDILSDLLGLPLRELREKSGALVTAVSDLVGYCKQNLVVTDVADESDRAAVDSQLLGLASHYDVDVDGIEGQVLELVPQVLERCLHPRGRIDYNDMVWLPVALGLPTYKYDLLLVDEAQDLNRCQQALTKKVGRRLVYVGDDKQSIYAFAGADAESLPRLGRELSAAGGCAHLPLTVTRRCGSAIVDEANVLVPDFEAHPDNGTGAVRHMPYTWGFEGGDRVAGVGDLLEMYAPGKKKKEWHEKYRRDRGKTYAAYAEEGDFVLCRCSAPLVSECFAFIREGRRARVLGRDIGRGLLALVKKSHARTVEEFVAWLTDWQDAEVKKEQAKKYPSQGRLLSVHDRAECLMTFAKEARSMDEMRGAIERVFADDGGGGKGITLSTVHKAKGLEADRVFFLVPEDAPCPHPMSVSSWERQQELNILYVGITRAKKELVWVS